MKRLLGLARALFVLGGTLVVLIFSWFWINDAVNPFYVVLFCGGLSLIFGTTTIRGWRRSGHSLQRFAFAGFTLATLFEICVLAGDSNRALVGAVASDSKYLVKVCVRNGADVNGSGIRFSGRSYPPPLEVAVGAQAPRALRQLLDMGADPNQCDRAGHPMVMMAAGTHRIDLLEPFVEHSVNLNARDKSGDTALYGVMYFQMYPYDGKAAETMKYLLEHGADPNTADNSGMTILMIAASECDSKGSELTRVLLAHGADRSIRDQDGHTASDYAKQCKAKFDALTR